MHFKDLQYSFSVTSFQNLTLRRIYSDIFVKIPTLSRSKFWEGACRRLITSWPNTIMYLTASNKVQKRTGRYKISWTELYDSADSCIQNNKK